MYGPSPMSSGMSGYGGLGGLGGMQQPMGQPYNPATMGSPTAPAGMQQQQAINPFWAMMNQLGYGQQMEAFAPDAILQQYGLGQYTPAPEAPQAQPDPYQAPGAPHWWRDNRSFDTGPTDAKMWAYRRAPSWLQKKVKQGAFRGNKFDDQGNVARENPGAGIVTHKGRVIGGDLTSFADELWNRRR